MRNFDINEAKAGKPVCTRAGRKARIICFDAKRFGKPIIALIYDNFDREECRYYPRTGKIHEDDNELSALDLMMAEDEEPKCPFKPFDRVLVRFEKGIWSCALFSNIRKEFGRNYYECNRICFHNCVPYNEETEHLIGTTDAAPKKYVIW